MITKAQDRNFFKKVATYYDSHREDLNFLLASDKIIHHHSGICPPNSAFPEMTEKEILSELHRQENALTFRGVALLGNLTSSMRGLDAGCGRDGSSFLINREFGCKMDGVSLSSYQVSTANKIAQELRVGRDVNFYQANMLQLPFQNNSFDFIWACESTEHIPELSQMFAEFQRVAKHNGHLVIIAGCGNPSHPGGPGFIEGINKWYRIKIHSPSEYLESASGTGWKITADVNLTPETIPYWDLRSRSKHKTGVEKFNDGYKSGAGEYHLFLFSSTKTSFSSTILFQSTL